MAQRKIHILIIEDEEFDVKRIENTLSPYNDQIAISEIVSNGKDAVECLERAKRPIDVVIMDFQISGGLHGERLIERIKEIDPTLQIIVVTKMTINQTDLSFANQLLASGAYWYCTKYPGDIERYIYQPTDFILSIKNAFEKRKLEQEKNRSLKMVDNKIDDLLAKKPIIGVSAEIDNVRQLIKQYADTTAPILITGESGTGKELVALNAHYSSHRKYADFIALNCGAIPKDLIESELFGFKKGSFTGAVEDKPGLFEQADKGTIFLDEISELPANVQAKLLRVLQDGEIDKIGRRGQHVVNARVIAATNRDLQLLVEKQEFREDLFYRINVLQIHIHPLRERREDIPELIDYLVGMYCRDMSIKLPEIDKDALDALAYYDWPGNVRHLKSVLQRLLLLNPRRITKEAVASALGVSDQESQTVFQPPDFQESRILPLKDMEKQFREQYFRYVRENSQSDADAARKLGLAPPNYHRMCKELNLK